MSDAAGATAPARPLRRLRWVIVGCIVVGALWAVNAIVLPVVSYYRLPAYARGEAIRVAYAPELAAIEAAIATGALTPAPAPALPGAGTVAAPPATLLTREPSILRVADQVFFPGWVIEDKLRAPGGAGQRTSMSGQWRLDAGTVEVTVNDRVWSGFLYRGRCAGASGATVTYELVLDAATIRR